MNSAPMVPRVDAARGVGFFAFEIEVGMGQWREVPDGIEIGLQIAPATERIQVTRSSFSLSTFISTVDKDGKLRGHGVSASARPLFQIRLLLRFCTGESDAPMRPSSGNR